MRKKDKVAPYVVSSNPKNGLQNVKVGSSITLNFNEGVKLNNLKSISLIGNGKRVGFSIKLSGNKATIRPNNSLSFGTNYVLSLPSGSFKDFAGNSSKAFVLRFRTEEIKLAENDKNNASNFTSYFSYIFDDGKNIVKNYSYKTNGEYLFLQI
ncbi:Ig-like domain-containing protein [Caloramator sp. Dgby_cultured_2]|uniref:Ig-like domain-containing protein n=1 Tax=Caloramator sp. Dgby_cultured_2 TaxID=3029174 RepID=UPI00237E3E23|nr:Ig-like domain-containing protein [Caloramator sp. Dgby_cultured_2]WDU84608.1 Ig-like domain-containing protein [Caloramator sp. Dgby_cultured_2]